MSQSPEPTTNVPSLTVRQSIAEVLKMALPLMISTGTFSLVLFADRTLLLYYNGEQMSASMAAGNLFWTLVCLPIGIASMTGAIVAQYIGSGKDREVGRFLWQVVWLSIAAAPFFLLVGIFTPWIFHASGQVASLIPLEVTYMRILLLGAVALVMEAGLSGFFSGTQRTQVIMWASVATGLLNFILAFWFIFGGLGLPAMGIAGAGWASMIAFWFKPLVFAVLLWRRELDHRYGIRAGFSFDLALLGKLLFFGIPAGFQYLTEAGGFTVIVLQIGQLGDIPLRATTMAINFNMVAFIPMMGVAIAASVLVGHHLTESGPQPAIMATRAALVIAWIYSLIWAFMYFAMPDFLLSLYEFGGASEDNAESISIARHLLRFVGVYVLIDATQLVLAGALRGAGDTWFVLGASFGVSVLSIVIGLIGEPYAMSQFGLSLLNWWWAIITMWTCLLAIAMVTRYVQGRWQSMRMVS